MVETVYNKKTLKALELINKLSNDSVYCDGWVTVLCKELGEIVELHLSDELEVMICTQDITHFISLDDITQENIRNFLENLVWDKE
jgi:hypothetical protein